MKQAQSGDLFVNVIQSNLNDIKAGLARIMQGCMTLNRALTMMQVPKPVIQHDAHVQAYYRFNAGQANNGHAQRAEIE